MHESEKDMPYGQTPKTWRNIQEAICSFFGLPLPDIPEPEQEACMENPVVCDLLGVSPSPPASPASSPDLLALSSDAEIQYSSKEAEKERLFRKFIEEYEEQGFPKENCKELAEQLLKTVSLEANRHGITLEQATRKLGL